MKSVWSLEYMVFGELQGGDLLIRKCTGSPLCLTYSYCVSVLIVVLINFALKFAQGLFVLYFSPSICDQQAFLWVRDDVSYHCWTVFQEFLVRAVIVLGLQSSVISVPVIDFLIV
jgi:hypothetical protein